MKIAVAIVLFIVFVFVGWQAYNFFWQERSLSQNISDIEARLAAAKANEADLQAQTQFLSNPTNLEKELRAEFNYKKPGEKMIIIVPPPAATSTSAQY